MTPVRREGPPVAGTYFRGEKPFPVSTSPVRWEPAPPSYDREWHVNPATERRREFRAAMFTMALFLAALGGVDAIVRLLVP